MIVVVLLTIATGAVLLWALYTEQVPPPRSHQGQRWTGMPSPADIRRQDFPLVIAGYDPRVVDAHLRAVAQAFARVRATAEDAPTPESAPRPAQHADEASDGPAATSWAPPATTPRPPAGSLGDTTSRAGSYVGSDQREDGSGAPDE